MAKSLIVWRFSLNMAYSDHYLGGRRRSIVKKETEDAEKPKVTLKVKPKVKRKRKVKRKKNGNSKSDRKRRM
jgi:hypothetical protein